MRIYPVGLILLGLAFASGLFCLVYFKTDTKTKPQPSSRYISGQLTPVDWRQPKTISGKWGTLDIEPFSLRINRERIQKRFQISDEVTLEEEPILWFFPRKSKSEIAQWLEATRLPPSISGELLAKAYFDEKEDGYILTLKSSLYDRIPKAVRLELINQLRKIPGNDSNSHVRLFHPLFFEQWIQRGHLSPSSRKRFMEYVFPVGDQVILYAPPVMHTRFSDPIEATHILQVLYRDVALRVYLRTPDTNEFSNVLSYWSESSRTDDVEPLLGALLENNSQERIDIIHLMPSFVRNRLNLYLHTRPETGEPISSQDCVWTSFNFFNDRPDPRFGEVEQRNQLINEQYTMVERAERLGDIIVFLNAKGGMVHACVYIAGPVVFTRDGAGKFVPFRFAYLEDVRDLYLTHDATQMIVLRRDDL